MALPLHVTDDLHAPGTLLGLYWMLFGIGAVLGGLAVGALRQLPLWPMTIGIVVAWGLVLLAARDRRAHARHRRVLHARRAIYGPFLPLSMTLMQAKSPPQHLAAMLAARSAVLLTASSLGTALGGPLYHGAGLARDARRLGLVTLAHGAVACIVLQARRRHPVSA